MDALCLWLSSIERQPYGLLLLGRNINEFNLKLGNHTQHTDLLQRHRGYFFGASGVPKNLSKNQHAYDRKASALVPFSGFIQIGLKIRS